MNWGRVSAFGDEVELDLEDQLDALAELEITQVEIRSAWAVPVDQFGAEHVRRARAALDAAGMGVSAIGSPVGKSGLVEPLRESAERLRRCLDVAAALGASLVRVFSFYVEPGDLDAARGEVVSRLQELAGLAAAAGVTLVHENERGIYGETPERCRDLLDAVASPAFRACFDPANFVQAGCASYPEAWDLLAPDVVHVHVKDALPGGEVTPAGAGAGGWPGILADLEARGYSGFLTLEPHLHGVVEGDGRRRLAVAAKVLRDLLQAVVPAQQP